MYRNVGIIYVSIHIINIGDNNKLTRRRNTFGRYFRFAAKYRTHLNMPTSQSAYTCLDDLVQHIIIYLCSVAQLVYYVPFGLGQTMTGG